MKEVVATRDVRIGMFVAELDRPWLDSPFLLQGFLIEDAETLATLRSLCRLVQVDRAKSIGEHYRADIPSGQETKPQAQTARQPLLTFENGATPDFFQVLRSLRDYSGALTGRPALPLDDGPISALVAPRDTASDPASAANGKSRASGLFAGMIDWLRARRSGYVDQRLENEATDGVDGTGNEASVPIEQELITGMAVHAAASDVVAEFMRDIESQVAPDFARMREVAHHMAQSVIRHPDAMIWLNRLKRTDRYSYDHALDVSVYLMVFARHLGLDERAIELLGMAGLMLDIGKLRLSERLLAKHGPLTPIEFEIFKTHVEHGARILREAPEVEPELVEMLLRHHERVDGSGYPAGLESGQLGLSAEMAGLVDSFCAMSSHRPWQPAVSAQQALERLIVLRGSRFSASLVDAFVQCVGLYPAGSLVELNSGEVAVVVAQNRIRRLKPRIMILLAVDGSPNPHPPTIDLLYDPEGPAGEPYRIVRALPEGARGIDPRAFYLA